MPVMIIFFFFERCVCAGACRGVSWVVSFEEDSWSGVVVLRGAPSFIPMAKVLNPGTSL